jgi:hypothetical protein
MYKDVPPGSLKAIFTAIRWAEAGFAAVMAFLATWVLNKNSEFS